jgi:flotillin
MDQFIGNLFVPFMILLVAIGIFSALRFIASRYKKIGPNVVGIFYGRKYKHKDKEKNVVELGFDVVTGGGRILWPFVENYQEMSTAAFQVEISEDGIPNMDSVKVGVRGVATCKISTDPEDLINAAQAFLGKGENEIKAFVQNILKGHLRSIIGTLKIEQLLRERDQFNQKVVSESGDELKRLGIQVITIVIQDIDDQYGYIDSLGKQAVAEAKKEADIKVAEAQKESDIKVSNAQREASITKAQNESKIAEANKERDVQIAQMKVATETEQAKADTAKGIQTAEQQKILVVKEAERDAAQKEAQIKVEQKEAERMEQHLSATVVKQAEADKKKVILEAQAAKERKLIEAEASAMSIQREAEGRKMAEVSVGEGESSKIRAISEAEASGQRAKLTAEADGQKQKLLAEAEGQKQKLLAEAEGKKQMLLADAAGKTADAQATRELAEALEKLDARGTMVLLLKAAPELLDKGGDAVAKVMESIFRSAAAPFGQIDKITITDLGGNGNSLKNFGDILPGFVMDVLKKFGTAGIDVKPILEKMGVDISKFEGLLGLEEKKGPSAE